MLFIYHAFDFHEIITLVLYESLTKCNIDCTLSRDINNNLNETWILHESHFDLITWPKKYIIYQVAPSFCFSELYCKFIKNAYQIWEYCEYNIYEIKK